MTIYLIGTDHGDLKGKVRLKKTLERIKPEILFVEGSEELGKRIPAFKKKSTERFIQTLVKKGYNERFVELFQKMSLADTWYEMEVCKNYVQTNEIPLIYLDKPEIADVSLAECEKHLDTLLSSLPAYTQDIELPNEQEYCHFKDQVYSALNQILSGAVPFEKYKKCLAPFRGHLLGERDKDFEQKIRPIVIQHPDKQIGVIVGAFHILPDKEKQTLYERIRDLNPKCTTIKQV